MRSIRFALLSVPASEVRHAVAALTLLCFGATGTLAQTIRVVDATQKVYRWDTSYPTPTPGPCTSSQSAAQICAAQNEFEGFQVVVTAGASGLSSVFVDAGTLTGPQGFHINPTTQGVRGNIIVYRVGFYNVTQVTDSSGRAGEVPDPMFPLYDEFYQESRSGGTVSNMSNGENAVFFVDVQVPPNAIPGTYSGNVNVHFNGLSTPVGVTLTVWPFSLPPTPSLRTTFAHNWNAASTQYPAGIDVSAMNVVHAVLGLNNRISIFSMDDGVGVPNATTGWQHYDQLFGPLITGGTPVVSPLLSGAHLTVVRPSDLTHITRSDWFSHFNNNGWLSVLYNDSADEPANGHNDNWCTLISKSSADFAAGIHGFTTATIAETQAATCPTTGASVDINKISVFIPIIGSVDKPSYSTWLAGSSTREVWDYQSCSSWGCGGVATGLPSYAIDHSALRARALEWFTSRESLTGELFWATTNAWVTSAAGPVDPWTNQFWSNGNGDGTLMYPGIASPPDGVHPGFIGGTHHIPLASFRMKMIREGVEDFEYLNILRNQLHESDVFIAQQIDAVFSSPTATALASPATLYSKRSDLACRIITDMHPTFSCTDPSTWGTGSNPTLTVNMQGFGTGTVTSSPAGINCNSGGTTGCQSSFAPGTAVNLTATADAGSAFSAYSGDCTGSTCSLTMNASKSVTATFNKPCSSSDCFNRADSANLGANWNTYQPALQITSGQATNTDANSKAAQWLPSIGPDQDVGVDCKVMAAGSNCGVMARWSDANNYYYVYLDSGLGTTDLYRNQAGVATKIGTAVHSIATNTYYHLRLVVQGTAVSVYFNNEATPSISVTDTALTTGNFGGLHAFAGGVQSVWYATFNIIAAGTPPPFTASVTKSGTGTGTVTSSPAGINCGATCSASFASGTSVTLTAAPASGSSFSGFSGGCTSASTTCTFTISANTTVNAAFAANDFSMSVNPTSASAAQGASVSYAVSTQVTSGAAQTLTFSTSGLPAGATASFNPTSVTAGGSSTMSVSVASSTATGTYNFNIVGTGSATMKSIAATLVVTTPTTGIAFRDKSTYFEISTSTTSIDLVVPASVQANDVLIASVFAGDYPNTSLPTVTAPNGWTLVKQVSHGADALLQIYSRVATATDPGTTYSWTTNFFVGSTSSLVAYSGVNTTAPVVDVSAAQDNPSAASTYSTPAVTTTAAGDLLLATYAGYNNVTSPTTGWSAPTGMTQRVFLNNSTGTGGDLLSLANDDKIQSAAGASGTFASTAAQGQNYALTALIALRPTGTSAPANPWADSFGGASVDTTKWTVTTFVGGIATEGGGSVSLTPQPNTNNSVVQLKSINTASLIGNSASVKAVGVLNSANDCDEDFSLMPSGGRSNRLTWFYEHGSLKAQYFVNGVQTTLATLTYSPTNHVYWRIRESGGTISWETSPDGSTWTQQASATTQSIAFSLASVGAQLYAETWSLNTASPGSARFANMQ